MYNPEIVRNVKRLKDENLMVRRDAEVALWKVGISAVPVLIEALYAEDLEVRKNAAFALREMGDSETLPRNIIATLQFSAQQKIEVLDALRRVHGYRFDDTQTLCRRVLEEDNAEVGKGAQAMLDLFDRRILVRASQRDAASEPQELLRASQGATSEAPPETLLRGAAEPEEEAEPPQRRTLWERLVGKPKGVVE
jgi:hypothetical protein